MTDSMRFVWRRLVVRDADLTDAARRVLLELESYADPDGTNAHPGIQRIAAQLRTAEGKVGHVSDRTVRTALAKGVERGFIELTAKAPRGRGVHLSDVYKLTFPEEVRAATHKPSGIEEIPATQTAGKSPRDASRIPATQTAGKSDGNTGNESAKYRQSDAKYRQQLLPNTRSVTPDPLSPDPNLSSVSNAEARELDPNPFASMFNRSTAQAADSQEVGRKQPTEEVIDAEVVPADPAMVKTTTTGPDAEPETDPLMWLDQELQGGFRVGEREYARTRLGEGRAPGPLRFEILKRRHAPRTPLKRKHPAPKEARGA